VTSLYSSAGEPADPPEARFCPRCGVAFAGGNGFVQEYWISIDTVYFCWCSSCYWRGEVKAVSEVYGVEPDENQQTVTNISLPDFV